MGAHLTTDSSPARPVLKDMQHWTHVKNTKRFYVMNPTAEPLDFIWQPEVATSWAGDDECFKCLTKRGTILPNKKREGLEEPKWFEMSFEFSPQSSHTKESFWSFVLLGPKVEEHFLVAGTVQEPRIGMDKFGNSVGNRLQILFSSTKRKHHCRACGRVICGSCSGNKLFLPAYNKEERVCDGCFDLLQHDKGRPVNEQFLELKRIEASLKADLREKQQQEEWFRSFLTQVSGQSCDDLPQLISQSQLRWQQTCQRMRQEELQLKDLEAANDSSETELRSRAAAVEALQRQVQTMQKDLKERPNLQGQCDELQRSTKILQQELTGLRQRSFALEVLCFQLVHAKSHGRLPKVLRCHVIRLGSALVRLALLLVAAVEARLLRIGSGACGLALEEDFQKENLVEKGKYLVRSLSTKVLGQTDAGRKKVYPANFVEEELDEIHYAAEEECDEEQALAMLIEEGDETALAIQEFEDQNKSKKGKGPRKYQSLAERIASSTCRACGARGHWKDECPLKDKNVTADANVILTEELSGGGELLDELPGHDLANWQNQIGFKVSPLFLKLTVMTLPSASGTPFPGLQTEMLDAMLFGEVDASLAFEDRQLPEIKSRRPPGVMTLKEWGQLKFPEGKWRHKSFFQAYQEDPKYGKFMKERRKLVSAWALSFQAYVEAMDRMQEDCSKAFYQEYARQWAKAEMSKMYPKAEIEKSQGPEWELLTGGVTSRPMSTMSSPSQKRPMEEEQSQMAIEVQQKEEMITRMAILQREMDKIKADLEELTCLQKIWPTLTDSQTFQKFGSDLLEIYCEEHSQITEQACKLGLKARRFTFSDGDLSTPEGQAALWKV
ncbi:unnamed protein product [Cladocopium goreaui]|uniref:Hepatocyte growth factor-regulated tyrosine kinase substrate n=1 Tax=Cladocopium goreaui TaxID=2562237 RepID=A0A9P1CF37_9DINO|nr:unnamed protein product [Cladocopium goreaui]